MSPVNPAPRVAQNCEPDANFQVDVSTGTIRSVVEALKAEDYCTVEKFAKAILKDPRFAVKSNIYNAIATMLMGQVNYYRGYYEKAREIFEEVFKRDKNLQSFIYPEVQARKYDEALKQYKEIVKAAKADYNEIPQCEPDSSVPLDVSKAAIDLIVVGRLRKNDLCAVEVFYKAVLRDPRFARKDNIYNAIATLLMGQVYFYKGNYVKAKEIFEEIFQRDKDFRSFIDPASGALLDPDKDDLKYKLVKDQYKNILEAARRDSNDIKTFWKSTVGPSWRSTDSSELIDAQTRAGALKDRTYLSALRNGGCAVNDPKWLTDKLSEDGKKSSMKSASSLFADVIWPIGLRTTFATDKWDIGNYSNLDYILSLNRLARNTSSNVAINPDGSVDWANVNNNIVRDASGNIVWTPVTPLTKDKDGNVIPNPDWALMPAYLRTAAGRSYRSLEVGPNMRIISLGVVYNIPMFPTFEDPILKIGSIDLGLGWERSNLPLTYFNYDVVGENGRDSWDSVKGDFRPARVPFEFTSDKIKYSLAFNSANLATWGEWPHLWLNIASAKLDGSILYSSASDIYNAMNREKIRCMTDKRVYDQGQANAIWNDPANHEDGDMNKPLYWEKQIDFDTFTNDIARLDEEIAKANGELANRPNRARVSHSLGLTWTTMVDDILESRLKLSPVSVSIDIADDISGTGGAGMYPAQDPRTLLPMKPKTQLNWTPSIEWEPLIIKNIPDGLHSLYFGNLIHLAFGSDADGVYKTPVRLSMTMPVKSGGGFGLGVSTGLNLKDMIKFTYGYELIDGGDSGFSQSSHTIRLDLGLPKIFSGKKPNASPAPAVAASPAPTPAPTVAPTPAPTPVAAPAPVEEAPTNAQIAAAPVRYVNDDDNYLKPIFTFAPGRSNESGLTGNGPAALAAMKELVALLLKKGLCESEIRIVGSVSAGRTPAEIRGNDGLPQRRAQYGQTKIQEELNRQNITTRPTFTYMYIDNQAAIEAEDKWIAAHNRADLPKYQNACRYYQMIIKLKPASWEALKTDTALRTQLDAKKSGLSAQLDRLVQ